MSKSLANEEIVVTQEGTELVVRPLTIKSLREFMKIMKDMNDHQRQTDQEQRRYEAELKVYNEKLANGEDAEEPSQPEVDDFAVVEFMVRAAKICLMKHNKDFVEEADLEDELDMSVLNKILEIAGGVKMDDPNLSQTPSPNTQG